MKGDNNNKEQKSVLAIYYQNQVIGTIDVEHWGAKKSYSFGRSPDNDIVIDSPIVSGRHAVLDIDNGQCAITDCDSTNGLLLNGNPITTAVLQDGDTIRIDDLSNPNQFGVMILYSILDSGSDERWQAYQFGDGDDKITIGRDDDNDISLLSGMASRHHALLSRQGDTYLIEDLNSTNGTFVNGERITGKHSLNPLDVIIIGNIKLVFRSDQLVYNTLASGLRLDAIHLSKTVPGKGLFSSGKKKILQDVSISVKAGEMVALIGGSGAGKSTLMDCLNGFRPPTQGMVLLNDDNFHKYYDAYKNIMGYVPQADIVYDSLTVSQMLTYAARLRMPHDTSEDEIAQRVAAVIHEVELDGKENIYIKQLSGGQKKRASIAVELLADPKLFFLDEPTSGLDPGMERNLMHLLRRLADMGKTIVLITHTIANLHLCDKIVCLGTGGRLCYFGSYAGALEFFGVPDCADIYNLIASEPEKWNELFLTSKYSTYLKPLAQKTAKKQKPPKTWNRNSLRQLVILTQRNFKLFVADRMRFLFLILQAPLIALLLCIVLPETPFKYYEWAKQIAFILSCSGVWLGLLNSLQEICKERTIYKRERAVNLKLVPYLFSKLSVLATFCAAQSILLVGVFSTLVELPNKSLFISSQVDLGITIFLTCLAATGLGLVISSLVTNNDRAIGFAPIILIPQLLFSGLVFKLKDLADLISYAAISRWSGRAMAVSFDLNSYPLLPKTAVLEIYTYDKAHLYYNWEILVLFTVVTTILCLIILKIQDVK